MILETLGVTICERLEERLKVRLLKGSFEERVRRSDAK